MNERKLLVSPTRGTMAGLLAGAAGIGVFGVWTHGHGAVPAAAAQTPGGKDGPTLRVDAVPIRLRDVQAAETISGQVEPYHVATLASEVAEVVTSRPVQKGDRIAAGQTLALLDQRMARATLDGALAAAAQATAARCQAESDYRRAVVETAAARQQARAGLLQATAGAEKERTFTRRQELREAQASLDQTKTDEHLAKIEADRYRSLVAEGAEAREVLDQKQAALDAATARRVSAEQAVSLAEEGARREDITAAGAQVENARASVAIADTRPERLAGLRAQIDALRAAEAQSQAAVHQARIDLDKHTVRAPFAGRVLATPIEAGERAVPGTPLVRVGSTDRVKITFSVPEAARSDLRLEQKVVTTVDAVPGRRFPGILTALGAEADAQTRSFPIEVTAPNPGERLLPNMVARLRLPTGRPERQIVIPVSAVAAEGGETYVFVLGQGRALRRSVILGATDGSAVEIRSGLASGETIAATPQRLTEGARVQEASR